MIDFLIYQYHKHKIFWGESTLRMKHMIYLPHVFLSLHSKNNKLITLKNILTFVYVEHTVAVVFKMAVTL